MGRVYLGRTEDGEQAAVKVVHADLARDEEFRKRFAREAAVPGRIAGPGIARVLAADPDAERPWLATEYIAGPSLQEVVAESGPLKPGAVRDLGAALGWALAEIHTAGLVHRDVKPSNVLMPAAGPKLIDFGIARDLNASALTKTGAALGTPLFMAPEQIRAQRTIGPPADVFALAGLLVYATTGGYAFGTGTGEQVRDAIKNDEPQLAAVPAGLRSLLERCLDKDPGSRPTATELAEVLGDQASTHRPQATARPAAPEGAAVPPSAHVPDVGPEDALTRVLSKRRRRVIAVGAGVLALVAASTVALVAALGDSSGNTPPAGSTSSGLLAAVGASGAPTPTTSAATGATSGSPGTNSGVAASKSAVVGGVTAGPTSAGHSTAPHPTPTTTGPVTNRSGTASSPSQPTTSAAVIPPLPTRRDGYGNPPDFKDVVLVDSDGKNVLTARPDGSVVTDTWQNLPSQHWTLQTYDYANQPIPFASNAAYHTMSPHSATGWVLTVTASNTASVANGFPTAADRFLENYDNTFVDLRKSVNAISYNLHLIGGRGTGGIVDFGTSSNLEWAFVSP